MFGGKKCECCKKKAGITKQKYSGGYLCYECHTKYCGISNINVVSKNVFSEISIESAVATLNEWNDDLNNFTKNYSNTFWVDEATDRFIVKGVVRKFNISDIIKFDMVEQGTSSEVKELYIQILTKDDKFNNVKVRVVKAPLNSTYKKTELLYRPHLRLAEQLVADLQSIMAIYETKQLEKSSKRIDKNIEEIDNLNVKKFCTECGTKIRSSDKFCSNCGTKL